MKRNDTFAIPQRQSQYAVIFIVLKFLRRLVGQLWPILLAFFIGRGGQSFDRFEMAISALGIFGMITSIISYFKYYYHISDEELVIQKGVLKKVKLNIPFHRIQSINFNQNFLHQALGVTEVEIETAGSDKSELQIDALSLDKANQLRKILLEKKKDVATPVEDENRDFLEEKGEIILNLEPQDLIRVGLVQNHFRPVGILLGLFGSAMAYSYTVDIDPQEVYSYFSENRMNFSVWTYILVGFLLIPISIFYSLVSTFLKYFNLEFTRTSNKFTVVQGLLTKKQFSALDNKIQIYSWGQNPFERIIGLYNIYFRQARSGSDGKNKMKFRIPGCTLSKVDYVKESWLGKSNLEFNNIEPVSQHYFIRSAIYEILFFGLLIGGSVYLQKGLLTGGLIFFLIIMLFLTWLEWKKKLYGFNGSEIYVGGGVLGFKHSILPVYKVQNVSIRQNPYQWRRDLATVFVHTAAGHLTIPYIHVNKAEDLLDKFIFYAEKSGKSWM